MRIVYLLFFLVSLASLSCRIDSAETVTNNEVKADTSGNAVQKESSDSNSQLSESDQNTAKGLTETQKAHPKSVRDFFNILPEKYFFLEGCEKETDKNCDRAREEYVKNYLEVEDTKNGYWKSGCDGAQSCLTMTLFKRPDGTYIVHLLTEFESGEESYFLDYSKGKWTDIGLEVVPEYNSKLIYVPPRIGTEVTVYEKDFTEPQFAERGKKIYRLRWKNGKFSIIR